MGPRAINFLWYPMNWGLSGPRTINRLWCPLNLGLSGPQGHKLSLVPTHNHLLLGLNMSGAIPLLLLNVFMVWTETTLPFFNNFTGRLLGGILSHSGLATTGIEPQSSDFFTGSQLVTKSIAAHKGDLSWSSS